jgi:hypothetical protein
VALSSRSSPPLRRVYEETLAKLEWAHGLAVKGARLHPEWVSPRIDLEFGQAHHLPFLQPKRASSPPPSAIATGRRHPPPFR